MTNIAMNPRTFNASSGLSRLRYHLSPHTFFVVVVFILYISLSVYGYLGRSYSIVGLIVSWGGRKLSICCFFLSFDLWH